ncbi:MAG: hypothetical protein WD717_03905 [Nitrosarchaeum sp.]
MNKHFSDFLKIEDVVEEPKCPTCEKNLEWHVASELVQCAINELVKNKKSNARATITNHCSSGTSNHGGLY